MKKQEISNGLIIEQLEERMEFTSMPIDASCLTTDQIETARAAGYTEADLVRANCCNSCSTTIGEPGPDW